MYINGTMADYVDLIYALKERGVPFEKSETEEAWYAHTKKYIMRISQEPYEKINDMGDSKKYEEMMSFVLSSKYPNGIKFIEGNAKNYNMEVYLPYDKMTAETQKETTARILSTFNRRKQDENEKKSKHKR